jgi:hypothetical protein
VLSDSQPVALGVDSVFSNAPTNPIDLGGCGTAPVGVNSGRLTQFNLILRDLNDNPLPAGTRIAVSATNGIIEAGASAVVPNTNVRFTTLTNDPAFIYPVTLKNDATPADTSCTDTTINGTLTVKITPPVGPVSEYTILVAN